MINYTITRTQDTTKITLPTGTIKYHNKLNNTSYYTNKEEQRIRTHKRSWKTIATVYLDNITLDTETITTDTIFTFHLKNTTNNTSIDIPVNNKLADFTANITSVLNPKHFYVVDLDNTSRFQTHFLDFINTVLIELNTNSTVLNELIEDTPVEEPPVTVQRLQSAVPHTVTGQITNNETDEMYTPIIIGKRFTQADHSRSAEYIFLWENKQDNTILSATSQETSDRIQFLAGLTPTVEYNEVTKNAPTYTPQYYTGAFIIGFIIEDTDELEHTATITLTDPEDADNTCTITV